MMSEMDGCVLTISGFTNMTFFYVFEKNACCQFINIGLIQILKLAQVRFIKSFQK